jgi:myo-inositol-1-phosphate synthase
MSTPSPTVAPAEGRLGVLTVGLGAVASTLIAGVELAKRGLGSPIGSLAQMDTIRLGKRTDNRNPMIKDFVPLARLEDIVWGAWDPFPDDAYVAATRAGVLESGKHLEAISDTLREIRPMKAAFERNYVKNIDAENIMGKISKREMLNAIRADINKFRDEKKVDRVVMIWCASTEIFIEPGPQHQNLEAFEKAIDANDPMIAPSMLYAYAAILEGVPFANGAPNLAVDTPVLRQLATERKVAISGKDFKTGQTLMKTVLAPMLKARVLGLSGWYSTNILGNRDGEVLDDPDNFKTKEESKLGVLEDILQPSLFPELYGNVYHSVKINYYPPRGDNKEGWDNIDIFGWLGYPMQIKVNFLCRDSILAAPLALDLVLFMDLAQRAGLG